MCIVKKGKRLDFSWVSIYDFCNFERGIILEKKLDIPALSYFLSGNPFVGSCRGDFRYRIAHVDDKLSCCVWEKDVCYELAEPTHEESFPATAEGLTACIDWLAELAGV